MSIIDIDPGVAGQTQDLAARTNARVHTSFKKPTEWKPYQKIAFRIGFLYMLFLCIPTYPVFYENLFKLRLSKITYNDFQEIVAFWPPQIVTIESEEGVFGIYNYINLILVFA